MTMPVEELRPFYTCSIQKDKTRVWYLKQLIMKHRRFSDRWSFQILYKGSAPSTSPIMRELILVVCPVEIYCCLPYHPQYQFHGFPGGHFPFYP